VKVQAYLHFDGRCEEAMEFYRRVLNIEVTMLTRFKDAPDPHMVAPGSENKIMHMEFRLADQTLFASDGRCQGKANFTGFTLSLDVDTDAEADRLFAALSEGGQVHMPMATTFFASRFGMVADRFGVPWMIIVRK
jgi:PhnB protein